MKPVVAFPFRHHSTLVCPKAKEMLRDAGFDVVCNDTGRILSRDEQKELIHDAFAIVAGTEKYDADMLSAAPKLKVVIRFGVGTDSFDLNEMVRRGIKVGVISNCNAVAEFTLTLILGMLRHLPECDCAVREGKWSRFESYELSGKTVGIIGFGRIGMRLSELLSGFGVKILAYDPCMNQEAAETRNVKACSFDEVLKESDIVSLHLPSLPETYHLMNRQTFGKMKDGAFFVNTARGALVDEVALREVLKSGKLRGAALDVFETEPVEAENPLFSLKENTVMAPHISALTYETNYNAGIISAESIIRVFNNGEPIYPVRMIKENTKGETK